MAKPNVLIRSRKKRAIDLFDADRLREADQVYMQICHAASMDVESWVMRGLIHRKLGLFREAENFCRHALKIGPGAASAHHVLGSALQCQGRMSEALACYRKAIELQPDYAEAYYFLANALRETGEMHDAAKCYRTAIKLQPNYVEALSNLSATLITLGDLQAAALLLNKAIALRPDSPQILCNQGNILQRDGRLVEALEKYQRALQLNPDSPDAIVNVAALLEKTNRLEEASVLLNRVSPSLQGNPELLLVAARLARRANRSDEAIALLEKALTLNPSIGTAGDIHFLLGQMHDKQGDAECAFMHLTEGNKLISRATGSSGDQEVFLSRVKRMHTYLVPELASLPASGVQAMDDPAPVFLMGFQRSGTTLLEQILDSHPALQTMEEKYTVSAMVKEFEEMALGRANALAELTDEQIAQLKAVYFREVARYVDLKPGNLLVDKMPLNTVNAHVIWRVFPQAKFILAIRHPCDVCFSCFMQNFVMNESNSGFVSLENVASVYGKVMELWQDIIRLLPLNYHQIRYEDLVADFEKETHALLEFLGVGWNDSVLGHTEHAIKRGTIKTPSYHQVTQPIYQHAKFRWKRYAEQFEPVLPELQPFIDYFGYTE